MRVVITGIGAGSAAGPTIDAAWRAIIGDTSPARWFEHELFHPWPGRVPVVGTPADAKTVTSRAVRDACTAARLATDSSAHVGLSWGASKGRLDPSLMETTSPITACAPAALADELACEHDIRGPARCVIAACASGLVALIQAARWITWSECSQVIAGSADFSLHPLVLASYRRLGVLSKEADDPVTACRPFDVNRSGFVIGEGAGALVLESEASARQRGAKPLAIWSGHDHRTDVTGIVESDPDGQTISVVVGNAIANAGLTPADIDAVCCHGTGTVLNDRAEARALRRVFGERLSEVPCFSLKGRLGHTLGASGALETALCVEMLRRQVVPPSTNTDTLAPDCPLGLVPRQPLQHELRHVLKLSYGFGGHVAAAVLSRAF